jgi:hypothetical protein
VRALTAGVVLTLIVSSGVAARAQQGGTTVNGSQPAPIDDTIEAGEAEAKESRSPPGQLERVRGPPVHHPGRRRIPV